MSRFDLSIYLPITTWFWDVLSMCEVLKLQVGLSWVGQLPFNPIRWKPTGAAGSKGCPFLDARHLDTQARAQNTYTHRQTDRLAGRQTARQTIALHCIALRCVALHCIICIICIKLHYATLHIIIIIYIALHCITLHYIALHFITLHCLTLPYITIYYHTSP